MTSALSWIIFVGNALVSLLMLWDSLRSNPHSLPFVVGSCVMLLVALLTSMAYVMALLSAGRHSSWFLCSFPWPPLHSSPGCTCSLHRTEG
jgi:hypothetical protein